jgi:hypothetical protein
MNPMRKRYLSAVCVVPLMLLVVTGCSRSQAERPAARCSAILSVGQKTYWDVQVDLSRGTRVYRRGDLSACSARISPRHHTGMFVTTYRLHGFDPNQALISPGGPGDPQTLWIATSGGKPPYTAPRKVQLIIDAHPVPAWMRKGVN